MRLVRAIACAVAFVITISPTAAGSDETGARGAGNQYELWGASSAQKSIAPPITTSSPSRPGYSTSTSAAQAEVRVEYRTACDSGAYNAVTGAAVCPTDPCPSGSTQYRQWTVTATSETPGAFVCSGTGPPAAAEAAAAPPQVTDAMVLEAFRRVPVPELRSVTQPGDKTLVNFDTIFFAEADGFTRTVSILGRSVRLDVSPESFRWEFGDGTSATTATAGAPYPSKDVVHRYADARVTVQHRVVVTWGATWSLDGGAPRPVAGTVTTTGPATALRVAEAVPALSGRR